MQARARPSPAKVRMLGCLDHEEEAPDKGAATAAGCSATGDEAAAPQRHALGPGAGYRVLSRLIISHDRVFQILFLQMGESSEPYRKAVESFTFL
jgi:hypothetical protein